MVEYRICDLKAALDSCGLDPQKPVCVKVGIQELPIHNWVLSERTGGMVLQYLNKLGSELDVKQAIEAAFGPAGQPKADTYQVLSDNAEQVRKLRWDMLTKGALDGELPDKVCCHYLSALAQMDIATQSLKLAAQEQLDYDRSTDRQHD